MGSSSSVIAAIGTASPANRFTQEEVLDYMVTVYPDASAKRKLSILSRQSGIRYRNSVLPDFSLACTDRRLFKDDGLPDVQQRMDIYKENALLLAIEATDRAFAKVKDDLAVEKITHVITVSCTGLYSPGLSTELLEHYNLPKNTFHTGINFMGCNASFPALRMADLIVKDNVEAVVLVVCVELCTIHFQPKDNNDNLLANTIFADGAGAMVVTSSGKVTNKDHRVFEIKGFDTITLKDGKPLMAWDINAVNFEMVLSSDIPPFIGNNVPYLTEELADVFDLDSLKNIKWAVHPGGKKILDAFISRMNLLPENISESYKILAEYGNMSSVTILFILQDILQDETVTDDIISLGFGPGITIEAAIMHPAKARAVNTVSDTDKKAYVKATQNS